MISTLWTSMLTISLVFSIITGNSTQLESAVLDGADSAVQTTLSLAATICLWSGVMEVMKRCGITQRISRALKPIIIRLFPNSTSSSACDSISSNVTANLIGLGSAATASGLDACRIMSKNKNYSDLATFIVLNTMSIQLIPTTIAAIRASAGAASPFDITPASLISTVCALFTGLSVSLILRKHSSRA